MKVSTSTPPAVRHDSRSESYELITVDVWDTLLRRRCHPDAVKLHVARYVLLKCWDELPQENRNLWQLLHWRREAERLLGESTRASGLDDEYRHHEVYQKWLELAGLGIDQWSAASLDELLRSLDHIELAQEKHVSYVDPTIENRLSTESARRVLFLSDFYLPADAIHELLAHHSIQGLVPHGGIVSCEVGLNKRSGRLFEHVHALLNVHPTEHLHLGDNLHSDVHAAQKHGITAHHFLPEEEHERRREREAAFEDRESDLRRALVQLHLPAPKDAKCPQAYEYGQKWSLLLVGFILQVMERAIADRIERLYFFTREGDFFLRIYQALADADVLGFAVPPARLLHVSRLATFAASLREFTPQELMRLWNLYSVQSLNALFKSMDMDPEPFRDLAHQHDLTLEEPITYPWQNPSVITFFQNADVQSRVQAAVTEKRDLLVAYLESAGIRNDPRDIGIVDIGWRGTIQDNLAYLLPGPTWHGYYLGLNGLLNEQPANLRKQAYGPDANQADPASHLLEFVAPIEMLCNSPHGSVIGYVDCGAETQALTHIDEDENLIHEDYVSDFQRGVLDSLPYWSDYIRTHAVSPGDVRPIALENWQNMIQSPPAFLAEAYFRLKHNETFGVGGFVDKGNSLSSAEVLHGMVSANARARLVEYLKEIGWLPGLLARRDTPVTFRLSLRCVLWLSKTKQRWLGTFNDQRR